MSRLSRLAKLPAVAVALAVPVFGAVAAAATKPSVTNLATPKTVVSPHLWATIDACNPPDKRGMIGIRGSMPGTGDRTQKMYMRFRVQYQSRGIWHYIGSTADTGFRSVGLATFKARQSGFYFSIPPVAGTSYILRGVVNFEWRKGAAIKFHAQEATTAGHLAVAGADPKGYSAAACKLASP